MPVTASSSSAIIDAVREHEVLIGQSIGVIEACVANDFQSYGLSNIPGPWSFAARDLAAECMFPWIASCACVTTRGRITANLLRAGWLPEVRPPDHVGIGVTGIRADAFVVDDY